jgi:hypothetical protein
MNKIYVSIVRYEGNIKSIADNDYTKKSDFERDLRNNEYRVLHTFTSEEVEHIKNTDWMDLLAQKNYNKMLDECYDYIKQCL